MNFNPNSNGSHKRRTKIIATLGPATDDPAVLRGVIAAGANVFRLNMSHGKGEEHCERARLVREVSGRMEREVALLADLQGPKIRVERFADGQVDLSAGDAFILDAEDATTPGTPLGGRGSNPPRVGERVEDLAATPAEPRRGAA